MGFNGGVAWLLRSLAVLGVLAVLLGIGVAVAYGPLATTPEVSAAVDEAPLTEADPGSGAVAPDAMGTLPLEQRPVAAFLGDSISRGMTDPASGEVGEYSWFYGLVDDTVGVVRHGVTVAENGMSTAWMADQVSLALASSPDILIVHGGTNDVSGAVDPALVVANLERIRQAAVVSGVPMAVCTLPPRSEPEAEARAVAVNDALRAWAAASGVILLDTASALRDPVAGGWLPGYSTDGLHPTPEASLLMSAAAARTLRQIPLGV